MLVVPTVSVVIVLLLLVLLLLVAVLVVIVIVAVVLIVVGAVGAVLETIAGNRLFIEWIALKIPNSVFHASYSLAVNVFTATGIGDSSLVVKLFISEFFTSIDETVLVDNNKGEVDVSA